MRRTIVQSAADSFRRVKLTGVAIFRKRALLLFLFAYWFYIDGVHTFVFMAVDFGMSIGLKTSSLMIALLVVQFAAFPSAILFGYLSRRFGPATMILAGIIIYLLVCGIGALLLRTATDYIILAGVTGIAQGGIQALSRSWFAKLVPPESSAEYFGFYNIVSRFAVIIGPAVIGTVVLVTRKVGMPSMLASRVGMSSISLLFLAGGILLLVAEHQRKRELQ